MQQGAEDLYLIPFSKKLGFILRPLLFISSSISLVLLFCSSVFSLLCSSLYFLFNSRSSPLWSALYFLSYAFIFSAFFL
jgi:hypothetical protein